MSTKGTPCPCCEPDCCCGDKIRFKVVITGVQDVECTGCEDFNGTYITDPVVDSGDCTFDILNALLTTVELQGDSCVGMEYDVNLSATFKCGTEPEPAELTGTISIPGIGEFTGTEDALDDPCSEVDIDLSFVDDRLWFTVFMDGSSGGLCTQPPTGGPNPYTLIGRVKSEFYNGSDYCLGVPDVLGPFELYASCQDPGTTLVNCGDDTQNCFEYLNHYKTLSEAIEFLLSKGVDTDGESWEWIDSSANPVEEPIIPICSVCDWSNAEATLSIVDVNGDDITLDDFVGVRVTISGASSNTFACCSSINDTYDIYFTSIAQNFCQGYADKILDCTGFSGTPNITVFATIQCFPNAQFEQRKRLTILVFVNSAAIPGCGDGEAITSKDAATCEELNFTNAGIELTFQGCTTECGVITIEAELIRSGGHIQSLSAPPPSVAFYEWAQGSWNKIRTQDPPPDSALPPGSFDGQIIKIEI